MARKVRNRGSDAYVSPKESPVEMEKHLKSLVATEATLPPHPSSSEKLKSVVPPIPRREDLNFIPARRPVPFAQDSAEPVLPLCTRTSGSHRPRGRLSSQPSGKRTPCRPWLTVACNLRCELTSCARRLGSHSPALQIGKQTTRPGMHSARASGGVENLKFDFLLLPGLGTNLLPVS